ncbi:MAG: rod shape-determining protein [Clostridia bacterium]|nr:rod shape-determining protein [Clostridia bacterium]MBR2966480.1 rod shape-determining protein [Clostridia bacterium]
MANYEILFDLGSKYISSALKKDGFFDKIPSAVVLGGADGKQVVAVGVDAINYKERGGSAKVSHPILEGAVIDVEGAKVLISTMLDRLVSYKANIFSRFTVKCALPCGMISSDKKIIEGIFLSLGARSVTFVEAPIACSAKLFADFRTRQGIVVDIGQDTTDLAIVTTEGIAAGCSLFHAGKQLTEDIAERVKNKYMVQLAFDQAERLKTTCASLYPNDTSTCSTVGQNQHTGVAESVTISSKELYDTVVEHVKKYVDVVRGLLASVPETLASAVKRDGVMLCGGGAKLSGLDLYLQSQLSIPVRVADQPQDVCINGLIAM